jgi:hypothetical protein
MICFSLTCAQDHFFEGWFRSNDDFNAQQKKLLITCPACGSSSIGKALMTPAISTMHTSHLVCEESQLQADHQESVTLSQGQNQQEIMQQMRVLAKKLKEGAEYVGDRFASEARKIHDGESDARGIYGEATLSEVQSLVDDGIDFMPVPIFPDDYN